MNPEQSENLRRRIRTASASIRKLEIKERDAVFSFICGWLGNSKELTPHVVDGFEAAVKELNRWKEIEAKVKAQEEVI